MDNPFDAVSAAVRQAKELNQVVDRQANTLADLLDGRLRFVNGYTLRRIKVQLRDFNAVTREWKS